MCQINRRIHAAAVASSGLDIETEEGNVLFANKLFDEQGFQPWAWSFDPATLRCLWEA